MVPDSSQASGLAVVGRLILTVSFSALDLISVFSTVNFLVASLSSKCRLSIITAVAYSDEVKIRIVLMLAISKNVDKITGVLRFLSQVIMRFVFLDIA